MFLQRPRRGAPHGLTRSHDLNLGQDTYIEIIQAKTAELFASAAESGAVAAGADEAKIAALRAYGLNLGLAFQLTDDALDYGGKTEDLGKNVPPDPHSTSLNKREIGALADFILATFVGK